jgi:hypothetical protein
VLHRQAVQRTGGGAERGGFADPAERDRRTRRDVIDIGDGGLTDLLVPVRLAVDGRDDVGDQVLIVPAQQLDQALLLAGELLVEVRFEVRAWRTMSATVLSR